MVDSPTDHNYEKGETIDIDYCCTDNIPNRPDSCGLHKLEVIEPGEPEIEMVESDELKTCAIDCDEYSEFKVGVKCDNCQGLQENVDLRIRWRIKQEGYECNSGAPDSAAISSLAQLSSSIWEFKTIDVCSIFESEETVSDTLVTVSSFFIF